MKWFDAHSENVSSHGILDGYVRVPETLRAEINEQASSMYRYSSGARLRFATDSRYIGVRIKLESVEPVGKLTLSGIAGTDVYVDNKLAGSFSPASFGETEYEFLLSKYPVKNDITIYLPLFCHIEKIEIGIEDEASVFSPSEYKIKKPIVFYGSSITHGAAANSPGTTYPAILARKFDSDFINLGAAGGCRGEEDIAHYISTLDMSIFVLGYDHNAINASELEERHQRFFKIIREKNPMLPILILSKPDLENDICGNAKRRDVIYRTYSEAQQTGDENVYFVDGAWMYGNLSIPQATVDGLHPITSTFERFADVLSGAIKHILSR